MRICMELKVSGTESSVQEYANSFQVGPYYMSAPLCQELSLPLLLVPGLT
jgi:hypothetical protein